MVRDWEQNSPESLQAMVLSTLRSKFLVTLPHWKRKIKERGKFQEAKLGSTTVPLTFFRPDAHSVRIRKRVVSSGMRTFRTLFDLASDWLMVKWSILIGREQVSRD